MGLVTLLHVPLRHVFTFIPERNTQEHHAMTFASLLCWQLPGKGRAAGLELDKCRQPFEIWKSQLEVRKDLRDHQVQSLTDPHLVTQLRALSATSSCSMDTSRDGDSKPPWAVHSRFGIVACISSVLCQVMTQFGILLCEGQKSCYSKECCPL